LKFVQQGQLAGSADGAIMALDAANSVETLLEMGPAVKSNHFYDIFGCPNGG